MEDSRMGISKRSRNLKESNLDCSKREFMEETGLEKTHLVYFLISKHSKSLLLFTNNIFIKIYII